MRIVMAASEATPLCKTGGLADVVHALGRELVGLKHEVAIILPYYDAIRERTNHQVELVTSINVRLSWREAECHIYRTIIDGITYFLLANRQYFGRNHLYGYGDDDERFAFFTLAIRDMLPLVHFAPDVIHCHDWQVGMLPVLIKEQRADDPFYQATKFVMTIHNPAFQGFTVPSSLGDFYGLPIAVFENGNVRFKDAVSTLKAGIIYSDKITTVSKSHAQELLTPEGGKGLESIIELRKDDFVGILNGIDYQEFDPACDPHLPVTYHKGTVKKGKEENRQALYRKLHLIDDGSPLFGMVSRLTWQKGIDLLLFAVRNLLEQGANLVILGSGEAVYEQELEKIRRDFPSKMALYVGYNDALAHEIYAASDVFLMPSLFEPCGIGQMIALRYGALPLVRMTGGLKDTVIPYEGKNRDIATGFGFYSYEGTALRDTISWAITCLKDPVLLRNLRKNAMLCDHDWRQSAIEYVKLYEAA